MQKKFALSSVVIFVLMFFLPTKEIRAQDEIGTYVFNLLCGIDTLTTDEFAEKFMPYDKYLEHLNLSWELRNSEEFQSEMTKEIWMKQIEENRISILEKGKKLEIFWNQIKFHSYNQRFDSSIYEKDCFGVLKFKLNEKIHTVQLLTYFHDCAYHLVGFQFYVSS